MISTSSVPSVSSVANLARTLLGRIIRIRTPHAEIVGQLTQIPAVVKNGQVVKQLWIANAATYGSDGTIIDFDPLAQITADEITELTLVNHKAAA